MPKNPKKYLFDISHSIEVILNEYLKEITSFDEYKGNLMAQDAIERRLTIIAEAILKLRKYEVKLPFGDEIINRRNTILHQYEDYNPRKIWLSLQKELPFLKEEVDRLLDE